MQKFYLVGSNGLEIDAVYPSPGDGGLAQVTFNQDVEIFRLKEYFFFNLVIARNASYALAILATQSKIKFFDFFLHPQQKVGKLQELSRMSCF